MHRSIEKRKDPSYIALKYARFALFSHYKRSATPAA